MTGRVGRSRTRAWPRKSSLDNSNSAFKLSAMPGLTVKNLSKAFVTTRGARVMAVRELSFTVAPRELFVLVGPSGSGKTTALRLIAGLESPDAGSIELEDRKLDNAPAQDRDGAMGS